MRLIQSHQLCFAVLTVSPVRRIAPRTTGLSTEVATIDALCADATKI